MILFDEDDIQVLRGIADQANLVPEHKLRRPADQLQAFFRLYGYQDFVTVQMAGAEVAPNVGILRVETLAPIDERAAMRKAELDERTAKVHDEFLARWRQGKPTDPDPTA